jgi:hypothetical protein
MADKRDQKDVLAKKDNVTRSSIGLQQWGDEAQDAEGSGGTGTAQRQARIARGQMGRDKDTAAPELTDEPRNDAGRAKGKLGDD